MATGEQCVVKLEDAASGQLFAQCKYDQQGNSVEQVTDSSRYFVLKIEDQATGRHAFIGLGFTERSDAFDFNVALQDHVKNLNRKKEIAQQQANQPVIDYSLKEGAKININIGSVSYSSSL